MKLKTKIFFGVLGFLGLAILLVAVIGGVEQGFRNSVKPSTNLVSDMDAATSGSDNKLVFIYNKDCPHCKKLLPYIGRQELETTLVNKIIRTNVSGQSNPKYPNPRFINLETHDANGQKYLNYYGVKSWPTILVINHGQVVARHTASSKESIADTKKAILLMIKEAR